MIFMNDTQRKKIVNLSKIFCCILYVGGSFDAYSAEDIEVEYKVDVNTVSVKTRMELTKFREANSFYLIESSINKDTCENILASINKPRKHGYLKNKERLRDEEGGLVNLGLPEMMIQTDLNIPRKVMSGKNSNSSRVEELVVDLNKDGVDEFIYRNTSYLSSIWVHSFYVLSIPYNTKNFSRFGEFMMKQRELDNVSKILWQWKEFDGLKVGDFVSTLGS